MEIAQSVMQVEVEGDSLIASWPNLKSVNSPEFFKSFVSLFVTIREKEISKVIIDSGQPNGGFLTDTIINFGLKVVPYTSLKRIALLESTDFYWDNSLLQIFKYLNSAMDIAIEAKILPNKRAALDWLNKKS